MIFSGFGVAMPPEMIHGGRANALEIEAATVEFRLGEIERLPVADASVDVILSSCVINLSPDKPAVFAEAFRVLRPGGRLAIAGCVAGAAPIDDVRAMLAARGFVDIEVQVAPGSAAPSASTTVTVMEPFWTWANPGAAMNNAATRPQISFRFAMLASSLLAELDVAPPGPPGPAADAVDY